ncbi:MAG: TIGR03032 family protein [Cyclobacteriaceae bacterium]
MDKKLAPFTCTYSEGLPELLISLRCTLAISTYQAGKVIFISAKDKLSLIQLPRTFKKPMGIAVHSQQMAVATRNEVVVLSNTPSLAASFPKQPNTYDALYLPRSVYFTGELDIHDLAFTDSGLIGVTTRFSCISKINEQYSFTPIWKPKFIASLQPDDHCHLNGMALENGEIRFVTALGQTDSASGWRTNKATGGILMNAVEQEIILQGLPMPHSPRIYDGKLYVLLSASGELVHVDTIGGKYEVIQRMKGFVRGMDKIGDFVFIGLSKLRTTSQAFGDLPIASESISCGVAVIQLSTGRFIGYIKYENSVEEIYDVRILPNTRRPGVLNHYQEDHLMAITLPTGNYWTAPEPEKG